MNRRETLQAMLAQDPRNAFARYGLAMEYANSGDLELALTQYQTLLAADATYAAAYFHGGQTLEKLGRVEEARQLYEQGIEVTGRIGDHHTQSELQAAMELLPL
jgi:tetratricopeptide (TPR) repeat protein